MKLFLSLSFLFSFCLSSYANCYTGFACSLSSLDEKTNKQFNEFNQNLEKYFSKKINEDLFFSNKPSILSYNDLFIFNTIV